MLKSAAENIYPIEVENCLRTHPAVADCAVIGVPDDVWVQSVKAIVVVREGETLTSGELIEHCRARIASYKKPKSVEFVDTIHGSVRDRLRRSRRPLRRWGLSGRRDPQRLTQLVS